MDDVGHLVENIYSTNCFERSLNLEAENVDFPECYENRLQTDSIKPNIISLRIHIAKSRYMINVFIMSID